MFILFFIINLIFFIVSTKIFYIIFKEKYIFPFRVAELYSFILNIILFSFIAVLNFDYYIFLNVALINCSFFYCIFSMSNMINTSPRTKIIFLINTHRKVTYKKILSYYNSKTILDNRILRLKTNNEIYIKKNKVYLTKKKLSFINIVIHVFKFIKKF